MLYHAKRLFMPAQGELEHRRVKRFYARTNKVSFVHQIAKQQRRVEILRRIHRQHRLSSQPASPSAATLGFAEEEPLGRSNPNAHYEISQSTRHPIDLTEWLAQHRGDPATYVS